VCSFDIKSSSPKLDPAARKNITPSQQAACQILKSLHTTIGSEVLRTPSVYTTLRVRPAKLSRSPSPCTDDKRHPGISKSNFIRRASLSILTNQHQHTPTSIFGSLAITQLQIATMPGRKSNLSTVTNGDEESPAPTGRQVREGSSVEVSS
jgi:hypothetical protein